MPAELIPAPSGLELAALTERMRPSEYTAAVLRVIEQHRGRTPIGRVIDVGVGSGVLLAALSHRGAEELWGVDVDPDAFVIARGLLARQAPGKPVQLLLTDVWEDVPLIPFDIIVANLPHFPAELPPSPGRNPTWSGGGRRVLDAFLHGLANRLAIGGVAWMTHHSLAGTDETEQILAGYGLVAERAFSWTVYESGPRIAAVPAQVISAAEPGALRCIDGYHFVEAHVLEIHHR
jgi:release factor glutamine methyltransferase